MFRPPVVTEDSPGVGLEFPFAGPPPPIWFVPPRLNDIEYSLPDSPAVMDDSPSDYTDRYWADRPRLFPSSPVVVDGSSGRAMEFLHSDNFTQTRDHIETRPAESLNIKALDILPQAQHLPARARGLDRRNEVTKSLGDLNQALQPPGQIKINENEVLGHGSNGTMVFSGSFDGRAVAVKRLLALRLETVAIKEIDTLRRIDGHPNVIRYYYQEVQGPFHLIALDRCQSSLTDVTTTLLADDLPRLLLQIALGLHHLHANNVVHRDLKPSNILLRDAYPNPPHLVLSDFGLAKTLDVGQNSQTATATHAAGTIGWRAPELLLAMDEAASGVRPMLRTSKKNDIFSLGLVFYYVLTRGQHPFCNGRRDTHMREVNIRRGAYGLGGLDARNGAVARHLIDGMLRADPAQRPPISIVLAHPFFWDAEKKLFFLCEVSDDLESERWQWPSPSPALIELEGLCGRVFTGNFLDALPPDLVNYAMRKRKYDGMQLQELLRMVRNLYHHYHEPLAPRGLLGPLPSGFLDFWMTHFPQLLLSCWSLSRWRHREQFAKYYMPATHV